MEHEEPIAPSKCRPEAGLLCLPLSKRCRPVGVFGGGFTPIWAERRNAQGQLQEPPKFMGVAYKVPGLVAENGLVLNYCPWCGESILRTDVDKPIEPRNTTPTPVEPPDCNCMSPRCVHVANAERLNNLPNTGHTPSEPASIVQDYQI